MSVRQQSSSLHSSWFRYPLTAVVAMVVGWGSCELFTRLIVPPPIFYSLWFEGDVHQADETFGFVFRPGYQGGMRHADGVWDVPLSLDSHGFRQPVRSDSQPAERRVILLGGASMAFSYGLTDLESLHGQIARRLPARWSAQTIAWPGFSLLQDLYKYRDRLGRDPGDFVIVCAYAETDFEQSVVNPFESLLDVRMQADAAQTALANPAVMGQSATTANALNWVGSVVVPAEPMAVEIGPLFYRSYVVAGLGRLLSPLLSGAMSIRDRRVAGASQQLMGSGIEHAATETVQAELLGIPRAYHAATTLRELGVEQVLIVALPHQKEFFGPSRLPVPDDSSIRVLDLRQAFDDSAASTSPVADWIAQGHYGIHQASWLAAVIESVNEHAGGATGTN